MLDLHHLRAGAWRGLDRLRLGLARPDALLSHSFLGLLSGVLTGVVIIGFRLAVEGTQQLVLPEHGENYEALSAAARLFLPLIGALLIAGLFFFCGGGIRMLGVANVLERMEYHQGRMSLRGFFLQFLGAAIAIVSGHSVGREGPHVHLGASSGSLLGQCVGAPSGSIRMLVACGTAAAISASFNTPLAGVVFALEVLMLEYRVASFIPIILASVSADAVYIVLFDNYPTFDIPPFVLLSLPDLMPVVGLSIAAGLLSATYTEALERVGRVAKPLALPARLILAGAIAGVCALLVPEVMGLGFDSLSALLQAHLAWDFLLMLLLVKLIATTASIGLGIPGGTIGPALFMGAILGNLTAVTTAAITGASAVPVSFYVLLGMGVMMGASLLAPLAALTAIVELTHNPGVILPGMLAIIIAVLVSHKGFGKHSLFITILRANGLDYRADPVSQT